MICGLGVPGTRTAWSAIGLDFVGNTTQVGQVQLSFEAEMLTWELVGDGPDHIDGVPTTWRAAAPAPLEVTHRFGYIQIDHVVVFTDDLLRTCGAISDATGAPLKRIREAGGGRQQGFHRLGEVIAEVVGPVEQPTHLWGFVLTVDNLDVVVQSLGPGLIGESKPAVQPGRRIASFRSSAGLGCAVALLSVP